jgi:hypothetical protein
MQLVLESSCPCGTSPLLWIPTPLTLHPSRHSVGGAGYPVCIRLSLIHTASTDLFFSPGSSSPIPNSRTGRLQTRAIGSRQLEDALAVLQSTVSAERHPLLQDRIRTWSAGVAPRGGQRNEAADRRTRHTDTRRFRRGQIFRGICRLRGTFPPFPHHIPPLKT